MPRRGTAGVRTARSRPPVGARSLPEAACGLLYLRHGIIDGGGVSAEWATCTDVGPRAAPAREVDKVLKGMTEVIEAAATKASRSP